MIRQVLALAILLLVTSFGICQNSNSLKTDSTTKQLTERLKTFNKLYGYVKYFHPSDEAAKLDWDAFAIHGAEQILKSEDKDFKTVLEDLFLPVAPSLQLYKPSEIPQKTRYLLPEGVNNADTIRWQHIGNGNFNTAVTYKSLRTGRPREYFPVGYLRTDYLIKFKGMEIKKGDQFKIRYGAYNETNEPDFKTYIEVCFLDNNGSAYECIDKGRVSSTSLGYYSETVTARKNFDSLALKIAPSGWGIFRIHDISIYKKDQGVWGDPLEKVEWSADTLDSRVQLAKTDNEPIFHKADFENLKTGRVVKKMLRIKAVKYQKPDSTLFKPVKNLGELWTKNLGNQLVCSLPLVLLGNDSNTFPIANEKTHEQLINQLQKVKYHKKANGGDLAVRIGNVINTWNIIHHFYSYFDVVKVDWYQVAETAIIRSFADNDKYDHAKTLEWVLAHLEDAHIYVDDNFKNSRSYYPPFHVDYFSGKYLVTAVEDEAKEQIKIGDELISINNKPIGELVENEEIYVSAKEINELKNRALKRVLSTKNIWELFDYRFKSLEGKLFYDNRKSKISSYKYYKLGNEMKDKRRKFYKIDKNLYYLNFYLISFEEFQELTKKLSKANQLIIDMRGYPDNHNGNIRKMLSHFTENKINNKWMFVPKVAYPDRKDYMNDLREIGWEIEPLKPYIKADIFYLINGDAQSYSESITGYFDEMDRVTMIGTPTAGANGNVSYFNLPGGYTFRFTGMRVLKQNGERLHGIGFVPDVEVIPTAKGLAEGRDEVLEKAIELASADSVRQKH